MRGVSEKRERREREERERRKREERERRESERARQRGSAQASKRDSERDRGSKRDSKRERGMCAPRGQSIHPWWDASRPQEGDSLNRITVRHPTYLPGLNASAIGKRASRNGECLKCARSMSDKQTHRRTCAPTSPRNSGHQRDNPSSVAHATRHGTARHGTAVARWHGDCGTVAR